jgi:hypothetical protein
MFSVSLLPCVSDRPKPADPLNPGGASVVVCCAATAGG